MQHDDSETRHDSPPVQHQHPQAAAKEMFERLTHVVTSIRGAEYNEELAILDEDVTGLLDGIIDQHITRGQPRIATQLARLSQLLPDQACKQEIARIIGDCASYGLTAEGQDLSAPYRLRNQGMSR